ncbi:MAG: hypothetical protein AAF747_02435 [Planctomycetota bacterium]
MSVLVVVLMLAMVQLMVLSSVRPAADEIYLAAMRVETARAFFAAESGMTIAIGELLAGDATALEGTARSLAGGSVEFVAMPAAGESGIVVIEGRSGDARRRIEFEVQ